jgi:trans-aconitate methyltransferase
VRGWIAHGQATPARFQAALLAVPLLERDAWIDLVLGIEAVPEDGPALPRGGVPYLPCAVDALLRAVAQAELTAADVLVDVGAGVGRALVCLHLLTGAEAIGVEIQPALVAAARRLIAGTTVERVSMREGDAAELVGQLDTASVFFFYCPFGGERLERVLDQLEPRARARALRVRCVDMPALTRPWLALVAEPDRDLAIYRSTLHEAAEDDRPPG